MALFFDQEWFAAKLKAHGLSRADFAAACGLTEADLVLAWKDQRELLPHEVAAMASALGEPTDQVAKRCGVSTPEPSGAAPDGVDARLDEINGRLQRLERAMADLKGLVLDLREPPKP